MKRVILATLLACLGALSAHADLIYYEGWNYADGQTTNVSGGVWRIHSSTGANDSYVRNHRLEVSGNTSTNAPRQADINRPFCTSACSYTNTPIPVYASFTINCTNLPTAVSNYIAHFIAGSTTFQGRVHAMQGTLPGTWRLGVSGASTPVSKIYPADLAPNTDYQVVVGWDPVTLYAATLWINPVNASDPNVISSDAVATPVAAAGFAFRQAAGTTSFFCNITNLAVATTFDEAATAVWPTTPVAPKIAVQPQGGTYFAGDNITIYTVAAGQGQGNLTYTWTKNGAPYSNPAGNSNVLAINNATSGDFGSYAVTVTTSLGQSVTSANAVLVQDTSTVKAHFVVQPPASVPVYTHGSATITIQAAGPPTLTYQWYMNSTALSDNANFSGSQGTTLTVSDVQVANGTTGTYYCAVTNPYGTTNSANAVVSVLNPGATNIAYLRSLVDPLGFAPTNTTKLYQVTGVVTTYTNLTSGNTASYYLQDGTGGINIFATFGSAFRPTLGDEVTFVGFLSSFNNNLELEADLQNNLATSCTILSNNITAYPAAKVLSWNSLATNGNANFETNVEGSLVMLTNVYFGTNAGTVLTGSGNVNIQVTNAAGLVGHVYFYAGVNPDLTNNNNTLPAFAYAVQGPLIQVTNSSAGYLVNVTRWADIMTSPLTIAVTHSGNSSTLTWTAIPLTYSYTVQGATSAAGPYTPLATGLKFSDANGSYTDTSASAPYKFYRVTTP